MTKIEALELELKARKMVEGTELEWWSVIRIEGNKPFEYAPILRGSYTGEHQLAIGIVEGKPVWNPQKPKTVMVELRVDDADEFGNLPTYKSERCHSRIAEACRKALEESK